MKTKTLALILSTLVAGYASAQTPAAPTAQPVPPAVVGTPAPVATQAAAPASPVAKAPAKKKAAKKAAGKKASSKKAKKTKHAAGTSAGKVGVKAHAKKSHKLH